MDIENIKINFLGHSGFLIEIHNKKIAIDPYNLSTNSEKADYILITHSHYDHCSIKDIEKISKEGTIIIIPPDAQSKITKIKNVHMEIIEVGDEITLGKIKIEAFPAYNLNKNFHEKKEGWMGFIIKGESIIIYHSGDCDKIPEMERLTGYGKKGNTFIAILPVSGKYVMNPEEASEAAEIIKADINIPMHYGSGVIGTIEDAKTFVELCEKKGLKAQILEKI